MEQRRPDAAAVARVGLALRCAAARRDRLPAQAGVRGPIRRHAPLVLRVDGVAQRTRRQVVAEVARDRHVVLERVARIVPPVELELGAAHDAVVVEHRRRQLDARRVARVARRARVLHGARHGAVGGLGAKAVARLVRLADAGPRLDPAAAGDATVPLRIQPRERVAAAAFGRARVVRHRIARRHDVGTRLRETPLPMRAARAVDEDRRQVDLVDAALAAPLQAAGRVQAVAALAHRAVVDLAKPRAAVVETVVLREGRAAAVAVLRERGQRVVDGPVAGDDVARPRDRGLQRLVLPRRCQAQVVDALAVALARDDVDRAGDRARSGLGGRCTQDLDPLDLVGRERVEREARRHALAVEQDLGVAVAQATQADRAVAAGPSLDRHAGQALEHVAERRVAEAVDLLAADDDLGRGRVAPLLDVVGAAAGDLHRREVLAVAGFRRWRWCGCGCGCFGRCGSGRRGRRWRLRLARGPRLRVGDRAREDQGRGDDDARHAHAGDRLHAVDGLHDAESIGDRSTLAHATGDCACQENRPAPIVRIDARAHHARIALHRPPASFPAAPVA